MVNHELGKRLYHKVKIFLSSIDKEVEEINSILDTVEPRKNATPAKRKNYEI